MSFIVLTASINCFISASVSLDPSLDNPVLSSSNVILPLPSVSMLLNICLRPWISSSESVSAMTFRQFKFQIVLRHWQCKWKRLEHMQIELIKNQLWSAFVPYYPLRNWKWRWKKSYLQSKFLQLVHCSKLFHPNQHSTINRFIRGFTIFLHPWMLWVKCTIQMTLMEFPTNFDVAVSQTFMCLPRTSAAVILFLGSFVNIFLMRSFAASDIEGHGALCKSSFPSIMESNIPFSVSETEFKQIYQKHIIEN